MTETEIKSISTPDNSVLEAIKHPVNHEMTCIEDVIQTEFNCSIPLAVNVCKHIIGSGGKRLRPLVTALIAKAQDCQNSAYIRLAAVIEYVHTATLLHDDVVDESAMRRGKASAPQKWGNAASILVGDFLYSRAFQMLVDAENFSILSEFSDTTRVIAEGEVLQLMQRGKLDVSVEQTLAIIRSKTGKLFEMSAQIPSLLDNTKINQNQQMKSFGMNLGVAFQLQDDVLDYGQEAVELLGKNIGDDLLDGNPTIPIIYCIQYGSPETKKLIHDMFEKKSLENLAQLQDAIQSSGALDHTSKLAQQHANKAIDSLSCLEDSAYKQALTKLVNFAIERMY